VPSDLKRVKEIGRGAFGTVWYGEWRGRPVAIKEPRETADTATDGINAALVEEAGRLSALPPHNNVLRLYGVCAGIDHQMLTNRGFLFLDQVLALVERDAAGRVTDWRGLRVANYDPDHDAARLRRAERTHCHAERRVGRVHLESDRERTRSMCQCAHDARARAVCHACNRVALCKTGG
jgi:hypothetical protein